MTVLRYAAGEQHRERNDSCRIEGYEYHMRAGFRNYAYKRGQKDHQDGIVAYPSADVDMLEQYSHYQQDTESPCENGRQMLPYDMVPDMLVYKVV